MTYADAPMHQTSSPEANQQRKRRYAADRRLRLYGIIAISFALGLLALLIGTLLVGSLPAFTQTKVEVEFDISTDLVNAKDPAAGNYRKIVSDAVAAMFPGDHAPAQLRGYSEILTNNTQFLLRDEVVDNPDVIGGTLTMRVPASDPYDQLNKGTIDRDTPEDRRRLKNEQIANFDSLDEAGLISRPFNFGLFTNADSRFPEMAGLKGAIVGSFYALLVCFLICFPTGIAAAIYLEEFAPKNKLTDLIEVNINNLAAVPSIVFGLLGLAVFIQIFGLPRSSPLVGGMVLSLMTLPTIIIVTRNALKAIPPSIREAGYGVGASQHQVVMHHVLPLALPGILTGTIIGLAQALGETAPLLLIGMNAFITSPPGDILEASTALPTQIFIWADSPERGFASRTSAAIIVLLGFLITMNGIAIYLRQRLERTWQDQVKGKIMTMVQQDRPDTKTASAMVTKPVKKTDQAPKLVARDVNVFYGEKQAIHNVSIDIPRNQVTSFIGPSGCGKSTFLRSINRMNDTIPICRVSGDIELEGTDIYDPKIDVVELRARVGMVFQKPNPFPKSIFENVAYGPKIHGLTKNKSELSDIVESSLKRAGLFNEVKDRLHEPGTGLSGGQQQRLCIARAIATRPEVVLMDEPCSALDPIATAIVEELIDELRSKYTIIIVTHSMQQAARVSQRTAFFHLGKLIEEGTTEDIFSNPKEQQTENYISGKIG